jgi:hypothetical protein
MRHDRSARANVQGFGESGVGRGGRARGDALHFVEHSAEAGIIEVMRQEDAECRVERVVSEKAAGVRPQ